MFYSEIETYEVRNGEGYGCTLFTSGCIHNCKGCFSPQTHNFTFGRQFTKETEEYIMNVYKQSNGNLSRFTLCGGDPLHPNNAKCLMDFMDRFTKEFPKIKIWAYTGYTIEELYERDEKLLKYIDILIDGKFELCKKNLKCQYRGSENQRIIEVKYYLDKKEIKEIDYDNRAKRIYEKD